MVARDLDFNQTELKLLEERLGCAERAKMARASEFVTVANATPPAFPANRAAPFSFSALPASAQCSA